jgi:tetratricopeptide (TPR) repeat protein
MKRILSIFLLLGLVISASGQKSRVLAVFQMIDQEKYSEAKETIELAVWNDKTSRWPRTYYAKGLLCQTAYEEGYEAHDTKRTGLYPDQLYVAYKSYERALALDVRKRLHTGISQKYYYLSNDFRRLGEDHFGKKEYEKALRAFEHALLVNQNDLIKAKVDTNLIYNTAMAAYESENWEKAIETLTGLHESAHAPATSLLLYQALLENGDSVRAEDVLLEGINLYNYEDQVVVYLINLFVRTGRMDLAIKIIDDAIDYNPDNHRFLWSRGLILRRMGKFEEAIESFKAALEIAPDESKIYYHIGVIYYNMGIDLREASLEITDSDEYQEVRDQSRKQFLIAVQWLEQAYEMDPFDEETISRLYQLYYQLQMKEKEKSMQLLIE